MIKKDGYPYCDYCKENLKNKKRSGQKMVIQNTGKKQLTFCNWTCAYQYAKSLKVVKKRRLDHLSANQKDELLECLGYKNINNVTHILSRSNVNGKKFTEIVFCDEPQKRRNEFYKLFKYENDADILWIRLMNWYYGYTEQELEEHMYDTIEEIHKSFGMVD